MLRLDRIWAGVLLWLPGSKTKFCKTGYIRTTSPFLNIINLTLLGNKSLWLFAYFSNFFQNWTYEFVPIPFFDKIFLSRTFIFFNNRPKFSKRKNRLAITWESFEFSLPKFLIFLKVLRLWQSGNVRIGTKHEHKYSYQKTAGKIRARALDKSKLSQSWRPRVNAW